MKKRGKMVKILPVPRTQADYDVLFRNNRAAGMGLEIPGGNQTAEERENLVVKATVDGTVEVTKRLMAAGYAGEALERELKSRVDRAQLRASRVEVKAARDTYEGLVGRVYHDPSWYPDCRTANKALKENKQADTDIVLKSMSKCASCSLRSGSYCTLMRKNLASNLVLVAEQKVDSSVKYALSKGEITKEAALQLEAEKDPLQKLKKLHTVKKPAVLSEQGERPTRVSTEQVQSYFGGTQIDALLEGKEPTRTDKNAGNDYNTKTELVTVPRERVANQRAASLVMEVDKVIREVAATVKEHPLPDRKYWNSKEASVMLGEWGKRLERDSLLRGGRNMKEKQVALAIKSLQKGLSGI